MSTFNWLHNHEQKTLNNSCKLLMALIQTIFWDILLFTPIRHCMALQTRPGFMHSGGGALRRESGIFSKQSKPPHGNGVPRLAPISLVEQCTLSERRHFLLLNGTKSNRNTHTHSNSPILSLSGKVYIMEPST